MIKLLKITFLLLITTLANLSQSQQCFEPFCSCDLAKQKLSCANFTSFVQLNFSTNTLEWNELYFRPIAQTGLDLSPDLDLSGLKLSSNTIAQITFENIRQFHTNWHPFKPLKLTNQLNLAILSSSWRFTTDPCTISNSSTAPEKIFANLNIKKLELRNINFVPNSNFCPLIFLNSSIETFEIYSPIGRINYAPVKFTDFDPDELRVDIAQLLIYYGADLFIRSITEDTLLNPYLFKSVKNVEVVATYLSHIDANVLQRLPNLNQLSLLNIRLRNVLQNSTEWLENLNKKVQFDFSSALTQDFFNQNAFKLYLGDEFATPFQFNDNDLCFFANFPHQSLVIPLIQSTLALPCSCTVFSIYQNYPKYEKYLKLNELIVVPTQCLSITANQLADQIQFCREFNPITSCTGQISTEITINGI